MFLRGVTMWIGVVAVFSAGCGEPRTIVAGAGGSTDAASGAGSDAGVSPAACGDGACQAGEDCLSCREDCDCRCGDGVCTFGEFCAVCPADCDCEMLAATPPMGWNSWNRFHCDIDENLVRETADAMVSSGMKAAGYTYLNLDDCWQASRDENGTIVADAARFPSGIHVLADYVHSKGLRFGLYTCAGTLTCQEKPGSYLYEAQDAATYAAWGVDYVKVDWCFTDGMVPRERYAAMRDGIAASGRTIVLSICNWGVDDPWVWGPGTGDLWRTTGDIWDDFYSMLGNFDTTSGLAAFSGPGHWNDPDMLEVGNGLMTRDEYAAHMSLWAIIAAPLIAGNDLRTMDDETREMLTNPEVIAVNQDPAGVQGVKVADDGGGGEVWARPLSRRGLRAVVLFNRGEGTREIGFSWTDIGIAAGESSVRDIWRRVGIGSFADGFLLRVRPHGAAMLTVEGAEHVPPQGESSLPAHPWMHAANFGGPIGKDAGDLTVGPSVILWHLGGRCTAFSSDVALSPAAGDDGTVTFEVRADGAKLFDSGMIRKGDTAKPVSVALDGKRVLKLVVAAAGDSAEGDTAIWKAPKLVCR
ncbi:MAG: NPCBM/NEW2 domain-containing protein [Deltaproteobacteria bacterium]|nr:NPCBM/NEW2 domain-containing protein [Deltaproteobacteria bacterium]